MNIKQTLLLFLKGGVMGIADLVPGISGGTLAFILGIYEKLISSIKNLSSPKNIKKLIYSIIHKDHKTLTSFNLSFLFTLGLGILSSIFLASHLIDFLLNNHLNDTMSFFIGLIISSTILFFLSIENKKITICQSSIFSLGILIGVSLFFLPIQEITTPSFWYLFISGFIGISAMLLPGISGSFLLLTLGSYSLVISAIKNLDLFLLSPFFLGIVLGLLFLPRIIFFLFRLSKTFTLLFLTGLIIGSLSIPISQLTSITIQSILTFTMGITIVLFFYFLQSYLSTRE